MALTKIVASRSGHRTTLIPFSGIVDDGSTLSLDFTTGVLDPRLTFTRTSNATFINSSGLVQYADANLILQSESLATAPWSPTNGASVADVSVTNPIGGATATQLTAGGANNSVLQGPSLAANVPHTVRFWVRGGTSTQMQFGYFSGGFQTASNIAVVGNGTVTGSGLMLITGLSTTTWTQVTFTLNSPATAGGSLLFYPDTASPTVGRTNFVWGVQINAGTTANPYYRTTTAAYQAPRFDYDPTSIGTPRGLLIEGSASTLNQWSEDYTQSYWGKINTTISNTSVTCPDGVARTTVRVTDNSTSGSHTIRRGIATAAGSTYTLSWFVKRGSTDTFGVQIYWDGTYYTTLLVSSIDNNTQTVTSASGVNAVVTRIAYPTHGWYRYSMTFTHPSATGAATPDINFAPINNLGGYIGTGNHTDFFGIQLELGSGASSYIPTGASTGNRQADNCYIYDTTSSGGLSWFKTATQGTFYVEMFKRSAGTAFAAAGYGTRGTATQDFMLYQAVGNNWLSFNWGAGENIVNYTALSSPFLIKSAAALSPRVGTPTTADVLQSINGTAGTLNTSPNVTLPFTSDLFCIGSRGPSGGTASSQNYAETAIRRIKFFPFAMTAAQMNALTTL